MRVGIQELETDAGNTALVQIVLVSWLRWIMIPNCEVPMSTYVHCKGEQSGPFDDVAIMEKLSTGALSYDDSAWREGMVNWVPLRELYTEPRGTKGPPPFNGKRSSPVPMALKRDQAAQLKRFSFAPFVLAIVCFFLPFLEISCQGRPLANLSGLQLAIGSEIQKNNLLSQKGLDLGPIEVDHTKNSGGINASEKIKSNLIFLSVLILTLGAAGLSLVPRTASSWIPAILGAVAFILMLAAKANIDNEILNKGKGLFMVDYKIGFIGACCLLFIGTTISFLVFRSNREPR